MRFVLLRLVPHPDSPCRAVERIEVRVERSPGGRLALAYRLHGDIAKVRIPAPRPAAFADELWRHTCFEAFTRGHGPSYEEFNLSPSGEYAAYRFERYRSGRTRLEVPLQVSTQALAQEWLLECAIPAPAHGGLSLSAVIEEKGGLSGELSYWALRHPPGKPDFHHPDAFAIGLDEIRH